MKSYHEVFPFLKKNQLLIGAWIAPPHKLDHLPDFNTLEQYQKIQEIGINTIYGLYENAEHHLDEVHKALDYAKQVGIHYLVRDTRVQQSNHMSDLKVLADPYMSKAAGVLVSDEPGIHDFEDLNRVYLNFKALYPNKLFYVNLMPIHANPNQFYWGAWQGHKESPRTVTKTDYYQAYVETLKLPYFSYDFYPFEGVFPNIRSDYFEQLETVRILTKKHNLIPLCFIQTCSFNAHVRIPTAAEVLWQVNTSLAYGTKGIQYFTYFLPENNHLEQFKGAIINHKGEPTALYEPIKKINEWLNQVGSILIESELISVVHEINHIQSSFVKQNEEYLLITNSSLTETLNYPIDSKQFIISMQELTGHVITLSPGEAILLKKE